MPNGIGRVVKRRVAPACRVPRSPGPDRHRLRVPVRGRSQVAGKAGTCICRYLAYGIVRGIRASEAHDWAARGEAKLDMRVVCDMCGVRWTAAVGFNAFKTFFSPPGDHICFASVLLPWSWPWKRVDYLLRISRVLGNTPVMLLTSVSPGPDANC